MTEKQIERLIKRYGWAYHPHHKGKNKRLYIYAARRSGDRVEERYIVASSKLKELTPEEVIKRLADKEVTPHK